MKKPAPKPFNVIVSWGRRHALALTYGAGMLVIAVWTVYRHITNGINYDVVGQIGVVAQWMQGEHTGSQIGSTNYVWKFPLYWFINGVPGLSPLHRLLVLALICNLGAYIAIVFLIDRFRRLEKLQPNYWLYLVAGLLAVLAGNIFWLDYANSRNVEVAAGLAFLYCCYRFSKNHRTSKRHSSVLLAVLIVLLGSLAFFADGLQLYVCGAAVIIWSLLLITRDRSRRQLLVSGCLVLLTGLSIVGAKCLLIASTKLLPISYATAPTDVQAVRLGTIGQSLIHAGKATLEIFGADFYKAPYGLPSMLKLAALVVLLGCVFVMVQALRRRVLSQATVLLLIVIAMNYVAFILSGQALMEGTSRYLIMVPISTLAFVALTVSRVVPKSYTKPAQVGSAALVLASAVLVVGALVHSWPQRYAHDAYRYPIMSYMQTNHYSVALASREVGVTTTYLSDESLSVLPVSCGVDHRLHRNELFYDQAGYDKLVTNHMVPIILSGNGIPYGQTTCSRADIYAQFGKPHAEVTIDATSSAAVYDAHTIWQHATDLLPMGEATIMQRQAAIKLKLHPPEPSPQIAAMKGCSAGMIDTFVAHEDDDLLFINPRIQDSLNAGSCMRTVYLTAGDAGASADYWQTRETGMQDAYSVMMGGGSWTTDSVYVKKHRVERASMANNARVSLLFMRLPDGNLAGQGFASTGFVSLESVSHNPQQTISTVDGANTYSYADLASVIRSIIDADKPKLVYTQVPDGPYSAGDHSDHRAVGALVQQALTNDRTAPPVNLFVGYLGSSMPANLSTEQAIGKQAIFDVYSRDDAAVCGKSDYCHRGPVYNNFFSRNYFVNLDDLTQLRNPQ